MGYYLIWLFLANANKIDSYSGVATLNFFPKLTTYSVSERYSVFPPFIKSLCMDDVVSYGIRSIIASVFSITSFCKVTFFASATALISVNSFIANFLCFSFSKIGPIGMLRQLVMLATTEIKINFSQTVKVMFSERRESIPAFNNNVLK